MPSNPIPLPRPDPEVQALKLEIKAMREHLERTDACAYINEERTEANDCFAMMLCWTIMGLCLSGVLGAGSLACIVVALWYLTKSNAARKRARAASEKLSKRSNGFVGIDRTVDPVKPRKLD